MLHSILASQEMFVKSVGFIKESVTTRTPEALGEPFYVICLIDIIVKSQ